MIKDLFPGAVIPESGMAPVIQPGPIPELRDEKADKLVRQYNARFENLIGALLEDLKRLENLPAASYGLVSERVSETTVIRAIGHQEDNKPVGQPIFVAKITKLTDTALEFKHEGTVFERPTDFPQFWMEFFEYNRMLKKISPIKSASKCPCDKCKDLGHCEYREAGSVCPMYWERSKETEID